MTSLLVPLPPISEQFRIAKKTKVLMPYIDGYGKTQEKLNKLNEELSDSIRKSILQEAIQGKLVSQQPEEGTAEKLLTEIRKEKELLVKEGKLKKSALNDSAIFKGDDNKYWEKIGTSIIDITEDIPFDIPTSWMWCRFGDVVNFITGKTPERGNALYWSDGIYNWVSIADMIAGGVVSTTKERVSSVAAENCFGKISRKGSLIMSFKLTVGRTSILGVDAYHNEAIISIYPYIDRNDIFRNYLLHVMPLIANMGDSKDVIKGKTLNSKSISNLLLPLPPLAEQQRIVTKIEELASIMSR